VEEFLPQRRKGATLNPILPLRRCAVAGEYIVKMSESVYYVYCIAENAAVAQLAAGSLPAAIEEDAQLEWISLKHPGSVNQPRSESNLQRRATSRTSHRCHLDCDPRDAS
jgi:hypothetical protein